MNSTVTNGLRASFLCLFLFLLSYAGLAQSKGSLQGTVRDQETGEVLPGATVSIKGTSTGVTSDIYGDYFLVLPPGSQTIEVRFLGFALITQEVTITAGTLELLDFEMIPEAVLGAEVVITGQLLGQQAAINQQINSNTIVNVVSKDKIRSLPDQNAAESVGRLPGIAIQRDGGEGQKVVVRGLSPRFNNITINGERIPSTDPGDRSVDLSFISPEQLEGIEVFKALRPDMDADAIGGQINFIARTAKEKEFDIRASGGYNQISEGFGQPRINASFGNRFLEEKLGLILTSNYQKVDRDTEVLEAGWTTNGSVSNAERLGLSNAAVERRDESRVRYGGSATLDFKFDVKNSIQLNSSFNGTERDIVIQERQVGTTSLREDFRIRDEERSISVLSNSLSGEHLFGGGWSLEWLGSLSATRQEIPKRNELRFEINGAFRDDQGNALEIDPDISPDQALRSLNGDLTEAFIDRNGIRSIMTETKEDVYTGRIDLKKEFALGQASGFIKFGGKVRSFDRVNESREFRDTGQGNLNLVNQANQPIEGDPFAVLIGDEYDLNTSGRPLLLPIDPSKRSFLSTESIEFLGGEYDFGPAVSLDETRRFFSEWGDRVLAERFVLSSGNENAPYEANEVIYSGYVMSEINFKNFMLMGGFRAERADNEYVGFEFAQAADDDLEEEVNVTIIRRVNDVWYANLFPMVHARYKFTDWLDVRVAYTETISRPNYQNWTPWISYNPSENTLRRGNPFLQPTLATNYDLFVSAYSRFGLLTVGFFYKELENIDVESTSVLPPVGVQFPSATVREPINASDISTVEGIEIDLQANFLSLPSPFNRMIFSGNATFIRSKTFYPFLDSQVELAEAPLFNVPTESVLREGSIPGQPDFTANISLGYEDEKFSARMSVIIQDQVFDELGSRAEFDEFTGISDRWDFTTSYKLTPQFTIFANANNFTNEPIQTFFAGASSFLTSQEEYGATFDLGVKFKLD